MRILIVLANSINNNETLRFGLSLSQKANITPTVLIVGGDRFITAAEKLIQDVQGDLKFSELIKKIRVGKPIAEITLEVVEGNYDLVIIGEKIQSDWKRRFLRTLAASVAEKVQCSVIIVKGQAKPIRRILLCDSGTGKPSLLSQRIAQLAALLPGEVKVTILHVMSQISAGPGVFGKDLRASAGELIDRHTVEGEVLMRDLDILEQGVAHSKPKVRHGLVVDEIIAEAHGGEYDLVVLGAHSTHGPQSYLLDNITHQVLKRVNRSIYIVKEKETPDFFQ